MQALKHPPTPVFPFLVEWPGHGLSCLGVGVRVTGISTGLGFGLLCFPSTVAQNLICVCMNWSAALVGRNPRRS